MKQLEFETGIRIKSISEAKSFLKNNFEKGVICPCCQQVVKLYRRRAHSKMTRDLINLYRISLKHKNREFFHVTEFIQTKAGNELARFATYGLIEEMPKDKEDTKRRTSGYWKINSKGIDFVLGKIKIPKYFFMFNATLYGFSDEKVTVNECLGKGFNYGELMGWEYA